MNKKLLKRLFPIIAILLLAPWPIAYGYSASGAATGQETAQIQAAEASAQPSWTAFGNAIGGVTPGDLFYINTANQTSDIKVTLYLTNAEELVHNYRYLILKVDVYVETGEGEWEKTSGNNGEPIPETFITMHNGQVSFTLAGYVNYKLTIDGGSFKTFPANAGEDSASPNFYLEVD
ncbi:hypothetical protein ACFLX3_05630 [Chloroflexota bacterium]